MGLKVASKMCGSCIFGPNSAIKGRPERMRDLAEQWRRHDTFQVCHHAGTEGEDDDGNPVLDGEAIVCRGFYDTQPPSQMIRIAQRLNCIEFVDVPDCLSAATKEKDEPLVNP